MYKLKIFLGILSLVAALGLVYANLTLPSESILFDIGYGNWPWAPPIIFVVVGIILLAEANINREKNETAESTPPVINPEKSALNKRLENIALGCFLILWGLSMFWRTISPNKDLPDGVWSICAGLVFLGLNAARYYNKLRMSGFTTFLGILSVLGGIVQLMGVTGLEGAFLLIILGSYLILKPWFDQRQLFGKAEE